MKIGSRITLIGGLCCSSFWAVGQKDKASLEGIVLDAATRQPIVGATIQAVTQKGKVAQAESAPPDGSFKLNLSTKESYQIVAQAAGYVATEERMAFSDSRAVSLFGKTIYLNKSLSPSGPKAASAPPKNPPAPKTESVNTASRQPLTVSEKPVELRAIQFTQSTADMVPEAQTDLDRLLTFMTQNPTISIELAGHTDNQGDFDQNVALSRQRADAVKTYLVGKGVAANRIQTKGYGGTRPVATNNYEKNRQLNRRVELRVVK